MGITDDRGRAMRAGEESLGSGQAAAVIVEAVRPALTPGTLDPCYVSHRSGLGGPAHQRGPGDLEPVFPGGRSG